MRTEDDFWWFMLETDVVGYEGEGDGGAGDGSAGAGDAGAGDAGSGGNAGEGEENEGDDDEGDDDLDGKDTAGLKNAIKSERAAAKAAARAAKAATKEAARLKAIVDSANDKDASEATKATKRAEAAEAKAVKLAGGYAKMQINAAIEREARALRFKDTDDAIQLVARGDIKFEQDEDDPTDVEIDRKTVKAAVKALADSKKHLLKGDNESDDEGDGATGGKFSRGKGGDKGLNEDELRRRYPALYT